MAWSGPGHQLTSQEYEQVRRDLIEHADLLDLDAPGWVRSPDDQTVWAIVASTRCSREAAEAWLAALLKAGGGDALRRLHEGRDGWLAAFDEDRPHGQ